VKTAEPPAGEYMIQIFASNLLRGPQDYALIVTGALEGELRRIPG
jgi:hypothetical protein